MNNAEFKDKLVSINRITKVVKGGRRFAFSALVVVGNYMTNSFEIPKPLNKLYILKLVRFKKCAIPIMTIS